MKSVFSTILTTLCLFLAGVLSYAQNTISVSGTVKDGSGAPVIGASVMQKGATVGAATDVDGKYKQYIGPFKCYSGILLHRNDHAGSERKRTHGHQCRAY